MSDNAQIPEFHQRYRDFWQNNLQAIDEISSSLDRSLSSLEKRYADFDALYEEIMDQIDVLASIYAHYETLAGREYLLRLRALLREYRFTHSHRAIDFNAIFYMQAKVRELRDRCFEDYPRIARGAAPRDTGSRSAISGPATRFRWITFERSGSWFIVPYDEAELISSREAEHQPELERATIRRNGEALHVYDPFSAASRRLGAGGKAPAYFVILSRHGRRYCLAADSPGRRIMARFDIVGARLRPLKAGIARGSLRLFGRRHLCLHPESLAL